MRNVTTTLSQRHKSVLGLLVLAFALVIIFAGSGEILKKEKVEQILREFSAYVQQEATSQNKEAKFQYGNIAMHGWGYDTYAIVSDLSMEISEKSLIDTSRVSISTSSVKVRQDNSLGQRMVFEFPDAINVIENSQLSKTITPSEPIIYAFERDKSDVYNTMRLPEQIIIAPVPAAGDDEVVKERMIFSLGKENSIRTESHNNGTDAKITYLLPQLKIVHDNTKSISIAELMATTNVKRIAENQYSGRLEWRATDMVIHEGNTHGSPYSIIIDSDFTGDQARFDYFSGFPKLGNTEFAVQKIAFIGADFNVIANGKVAYAVDDPLPSGNLDIEIVNAEQLIASDIISAPFKAGVRSALYKMSGTKDSFGERTAINIKREKNGVLYVGGMTFEELTASMLGEFFKLTSPADTKPDMPVTAPVPSQEIPVPSPDAADSLSIEQEGIMPDSTPQQ